MSKTAPIRALELDFVPKGCSLSILREDVLHPQISGNKFRKLKYNLKASLQSTKKGVLTYGGAFSNHLVATAYACKLLNIPSVGIVRGEELKNKSLNPSLAFCAKQGMELVFVSRHSYREIAQKGILNQDLEQYADHTLIPEGGTNDLGIQGTREILSDATAEFTHIAVAIGSGGTFIGLAHALQSHQELLGFSAVRTDPNLPTEIAHKMPDCKAHYFVDYNFGGYAKITQEYINFVNQFQKESKTPLDCIYTGKMFWGLSRLFQTNYFPQGAKVLAIHTGGLQGNVGMNLNLKKKGLPEINIL